MVHLNNTKRIPSIMKNFNFSADDIRCKKCKNCCCLKDGVYYHPEDFDGDIVESVVAMMEQRLVTTTRSYYGLVITSTRIVIGRTKYSFPIYRCVYLTSFGCFLPSQQRPHTCRHYGPIGNKSRGEQICESPFTYGDYVKAWEPYIEMIVTEAKRRGIGCLT